MSSKKYSKKKSVSQTSSAPVKALDPFAILATFYAMWTMIITTFWLEDQYFNQTEAKGHAFLMGAGITVVVLLCISIFTQNAEPLLPQKDVTEIAVASFGVLAIISTLLSDYTLNSLFGTRGWWVGGLQMLLFAVIVIFLSNKLKWSELLSGTLITVGFILYFIEILHCAGIDFLYLHRNMYPGELISYLSTIGNTNWFMGYIALTMPVILILFMRNTEKKTDIIYGIYLFMACIGTVFVRVDGLYIGLGLCMFFAVPFVLMNVQHLRKFFLFVGMYGLAAMVMAFVPAFERIRPESNGSLAYILSMPIVAVALTAGGFVGYLIVRLFIKNLNTKISRAMIIVLEVALTSVVVYFVVDAVRDFNDNWGSGRGMIWTYAVNMFKEMPLVDKLFGVGPETLFVYNQELNQMFGKTVLVNHSDFLQFLVTNGILGLGAWGTMWISIIVRQMKTRKMDDMAFAFFIPLIAYLGQSTVNTAECLSWPFLIVVMGLWLHYQKERETQICDEEA